MLTLSARTQLPLQPVLEAVTPLQLMDGRAGGVHRGRASDDSRDSVLDLPPGSRLSLHLLLHLLHTALHLLQAFLDARPLLLQLGLCGGCSLLQR